MRHGKTHNHLGRTTSHRKAMLSNMASSLLIHKRITTTLAKAKELRKYVEPLVNRSKDDTTHSRRTVFSYLQDKESVKELFDNIAQKVADRPGGYTRIIKLGARLGDNAETCIIELVDYNDVMLKAKEATGKTKTRRSRRGGKGKGVETVQNQEVTSAILLDEPSVEEVKTATVETENAVAETPALETSAIETASVETSAIEEAQVMEETPEPKAPEITDIDNPAKEEDKPEA
jgi:large subunit ribosomal protein L17